MSRDDLHFRLRIPKDLKARVEQASLSNHRSMTAEIVATLEEKYPPEKTGNELLLQLLTDFQEAETDEEILRMADQIKAATLPMDADDITRNYVLFVTLNHLKKYGLASDADIKFYDEVHALANKSDGLGR